jgi:hypothetical protein
LLNTWLSPVEEVAEAVVAVAVVQADTVLALVGNPLEEDHLPKFHYLFCPQTITR